MTLKDRHPFAVDQLNQMQRYLGEEMIEDYHTGELTRRQMLKRLLGICGSATAAAALLAACGDGTATPPAATAGAAPSAVPPAADLPTAAPAAPTAAQPTAAAATAAPAAGAAGAASPLSVAADDPNVTGDGMTFQSDTTVDGYVARPK